MTTDAQIEALRRMLAEAEALAASGDGLLGGLYTSLASRIETALAVLADAEPEARRTP